MDFIRREEPYSGYVVRTTENGRSYRVAKKWPDEPDSVALCEYFPGTGWGPYRDLTPEERDEYYRFIEQFQ